MKSWTTHKDSQQKKCSSLLPIYGYIKLTWLQENKVGRVEASMLTYQAKVTIMVSRD